jgi:adenylate cyclase class IV
MARNVEGLWDFLELEVELRDGEPPESGVTEADHLMARLDISADQLIEGANVDLLARGCA